MLSKALICNTTVNGSGFNPFRTCVCPARTSLLCKARSVIKAEFTSKSNAKEKPPKSSKSSWYPDPSTWKDFVKIDATRALSEFGRSGRLDVVLLTVNDQEYNAVIQRFSGVQPVHRANVGVLTVWFTKIGLSEDSTVNIAIVKQKMGAASAQNMVSNVIKYLKPRVIVSVGVGWGNESHYQKPKLGDVMVSESILEFTDKVEISKGVFHSRSPVPPAGKLLIDRFSAEAAPGNWAFPRVGKTVCKVLVGKVATGGVLINDADFLQQLVGSSHYRDIIGGEMEAWGIFSAIHNELKLPPQWIVVKGICDWGLDLGNGWQPFAAAAAADLVHVVLSAPDALTVILGGKKAAKVENRSWVGMDLGVGKRLSLPAPQSQVGPDPGLQAVELPTGRALLRVAISYCSLDGVNEQRTRALADKLSDLKSPNFDIVIDYKNGGMAWPQFLNLMFKCPKMIVIIDDKYAKCAMGDVEIRNRSRGSGAFDEYNRISNALYNLGDQPNTWLTPVIFPDFDSSLIPHNIAVRSYQTVNTETWAGFDKLVESLLYTHPGSHPDNNAPTP